MNKSQRNGFLKHPLQQILEIIRKKKVRWNFYFFYKCFAVNVSKFVEELLLRSILDYVQIMKLTALVS